MSAVCFGTRALAQSINEQRHHSASLSNIAFARWRCEASRCE
jgi:hypothetical protein